MSRSRNRNQQLTRGVEPFFRTASGEGLERILSSLEAFAAERDLELPPIDPRTILVSARDLRENREALRPLDIYGEFFIRDVIAEIPNLAKPRTAVAERIRLHQKAGVHWLSLRFDQPSLAAINRERVELEDMLHFMSGADDLSFGGMEPEIHIARMGETIPTSPAERIASFVSKQLPFPVELAPVHDPNAGAQ